MKPPRAPRSADEDLGRHIRDARLARNLTLEELAARTGLSRSYLSNVERNVNSPTVSTLRTILDALGVSLVDLFRSVDGERRPVTRKSERLEIVNTDNATIRYELLNPDPPGKLELILLHVEPGAHSGERDHTHAGEEVGLILTGRLNYWVDSEFYELGEGDAISYEASRPHRYENPGTETCTSLWALTPPSF